MTRRVQGAGPGPLEARVRGEYLEMPGHRLTVAQAMRLWGVDEESGASVLERLVDDGFLRRAGPYYFRADLGTGYEAPAR